MVFGLMKTCRAAANDAHSCSSLCIHKTQHLDSDKFPFVTKHVSFNERMNV